MAAPRAISRLRLSTDQLAVQPYRQDVLANVFVIHVDAVQEVSARAAGLGHQVKHGWVTLLIMRDDQLPLQLLEAWIDESYRAVAPKRLLAELDDLRQPHRSRDEQLPYSPR